jgi:hypothetical protein
MATQNSTVKEREKPLRKLETLLIICHEMGAACGRLRGLGEEEIVFVADINQVIADRFSAGFRWDGGFVTIEELEKVREDNGGAKRIIRARILKITAAARSSLMNLLNASSLS